jgi:DNA-binding IclR family transcriptional regulator
MDDLSNPTAGKHRIPVIDRMMDVLYLLEQRGAEGATIRELVVALKLPRTSVYRILNTLLGHDMVRRSGRGDFRLGPRLITLAARTLAGAHDYDLATLSKPHLERLAGETGEGCKVSIRDGNRLQVVAAVNGTRQYALSVVAGPRLQLHAGAAGKILMAALTKEELDEQLSAPLVKFTPRTIIDTPRLKAELTRVRKQGWSADRGEYAPSIWAFGAPIHSPAGSVVAALSVPFLAGAPKGHMDKIRVTTIAVAEAISSDLPTN